MMLIQTKLNWKTMALSRGNLRLLMLFSSLSCILFLVPIGNAADWLSWRGSNYDGIGEALNLPASWNENEGILWQRPLPGTGYSSPIVIGDQVVLTTSDGLDYTELYVVSLNAFSGELNWKTKFLSD